MAESLADGHRAEVYRKQLLHLIPMLENRRDTVLSGLERNAPSADLHAFAREELQALTPDIEALEADLEDLSPRDAEERMRLRGVILMLEDELAFIYSELHESTHAAAAEQRRFMQVLSVAVLALISLLLLVAIALAVALIKVFGQRAALAALSFTDPLTGLDNRRAFESRANQALLEARRRGNALSLGFIDVDHFKPLNDEHGHPVGDEVLRALAGVLTDAARVVDTVSRVGGEEFALLMPDADAEGARRFGERLRRAVQSAELSARAPGLRVTISIGLASVSSDQSAWGLDGLYTLADRALYQAKRQGRNRVFHAEDLPPVGELQ